MTTDALKNIIFQQYPDFKIEESCDFPVLFVPTEKLIDVACWLIFQKELYFDMLVCETAVDKPENFEMVYHLTSTKFRHDLVLKVILDNKITPEVASVAKLWKSAELFECEIYDLFGIHFSNHPNLRRLFMPDDWDGYPLRKDYDPNKVVIG
jgi:NADH:ubiquinone oxidoreductase subunit C